MNKLFTAASITLLLAGAMPVGAQYRERPDPDYYRMPDRAAPVPWQYPGERISYRVRVQRQSTPGAYYIRIDTGNSGADAVQLRVQGNTLLIGSNRSLQNEQRSDRGGYRFSRFSSAFSQRIRLPRDADTANMRRAEEGGVITLAIPRVREGFRYGRGYGYGR